MSKGKKKLSLESKVRKRQVKATAMVVDIYQDVRQLLKKECQKEIGTRAITVSEMREINAVSVDLTGIIVNSLNDTVTINGK